MITTEQIDQVLSAAARLNVGAGGNGVAGGNGGINTIINGSPLLYVFGVIFMVIGIAWGVVTTDRADHREKLLTAEQAHKEALLIANHEKTISIAAAEAQMAKVRWESTVEVLAANRRADMAQLVALQSDTSFAKAQASTAKTLANEIDKRLGQRVAILEGKQP